MSFCLEIQTLPLICCCALLKPVIRVRHTWATRGVTVSWSAFLACLLWLGEVESLTCNFYLSVAARKIIWADPSLRYTSMLLGCKASNQLTFLACHQCYCVGSSLAGGLNLLALVMWHFLKLVARSFLRVLRFPPLLHRLMVQPIK